MGMSYNNLEMTVDRMCRHLLILLLLLSFNNCNGEDTLTRHTDIILVGSMGDLSKKYLLHGFFNLFSKYSSDVQTFSFYPSGRSSIDSTNSTFMELLKDKIECNQLLHADENDCRNMKEEFYSITKYVQLKTAEHYAQFCNDLKEKWQKLTSSQSSMQVDVIIYLSIPSSGYVLTANLINNNCRFKSDRWRLKVIMEKPFGHDRKSAKQMGLELSYSFNEEEIYRVDHYLGKTIAREILNFRKQNNEIEKLLNRGHVDYVEVFMKELIGVKGRIEFYDQTGVIKDVLQNHLTELLTLVTMEMPRNMSSSTDVKVSKLRLLKQIEPVTMSATLMGQYSDYMREAEEEGADLLISKFTPTFAAAKLSINSPRWHGVPCVLLAGKELDERASFIRITFKRNTVCVKRCDDKSLEQLVFHFFGQGDLMSPAIIVSKSLVEPVWPKGFHDQYHEAAAHSVYSQDFKDLFVGVPEEDPDAYSILIEDLYFGNKDRFIGTNHLLALWTVWTDVAVKSGKVLPSIYEPGDIEDDLAFRLTHHGLDFKNTADSVVSQPDPNESRQTPATFLGQKLITSGRDNLAYLLAKDIADSIQERLEVSLTFHIAFSGGSTPVPLMEALVQHFGGIPWKYVHIWQVDERCLPQSGANSNFQSLENHLLKHVPIPYFNIHPMPVEITGKVCSPHDKGHKFYQELIIDQISDKRFDYIVLGLGSDGHTASLFPNANVLNSIQLTEMTEDPQGVAEWQRMTLTLQVINRAKHISLLVTGAGKKEILSRLEESEESMEEYPVLAVKPDVGSTLTWYIDDEALIVTDHH